MKKSVQADAENFRRELNNYQLTIKDWYQELEENPFLDKQINFWTESTRFFIAELEIWGELKNAENYEATIKLVQKALYRLNKLIVQLTKENHSDFKEQ